MLAADAVVTVMFASAKRRKILGRGDRRAGQLYVYRVCQVACNTIQGEPKVILSSQMSQAVGDLRVKVSRGDSEFQAKGIL